MIGLVWAQSANGVIGADGRIPWRIPEDMDHFSQLTAGSTVVMGRATWESLPPRFRPLPERRNVVLSGIVGAVAAILTVAFALRAFDGGSALDWALFAVLGAITVIHAAAVYSFKRRDRETMLRGNVDGTRTVLEAGRDAGATHLVHVSSTVALTRPGRPVLDHRSPLGPGFGPYSDSKVASERVARTMQQHGDPVTIINPGGVLGPHDPYLGESNAVVVEILKGKTPVFPRGRVPYVDVRDTAATLASALEVDPGGRYVVPGESVANLHEPLREVTGRSLPCRTVPPALAVAATTPGYLTGWSLLPGAVEGVRITACGCRLDHSETTRVLGVEPRPLVESLADTVAWLKSAGHLGRRSTS